MASAVQLVGGNQIVRLGSPLIIGLRLQGTIGHTHATSQHSIKPRPYLRYLAETLQQLRCDVTLLVSTNHQFDSHLISQFAALNFPVPFRLLHDHDDNKRGNSENKKVSSRNYGAFFRTVAESHGTNTERVLFIDSEINYRFSPVQTLVMEAFEPMSRRQQRQEQRQRMREAKERHASAPVADHAASQPHTTQLSSSAASRDRSVEHPAETAQRHRSQQRRRDEHQSQVRAAINAIENDTAFLADEQRFASAAAAVPSPAVDGTFDDFYEASAAQQQQAGAAAAPPGGGSGGGWLGRHDARKRAVTGANPNTTDAPPSGESHPGGNGGAFTSDDYAEAAATDLAINMEDFSLIALADMITQLATSDVAVREFLKTEPLIEKLRVPFHGIANYLPIENCDYIEVLDWERIRVEEQESRESGVPDIEETEDHRDFFK